MTRDPQVSRLEGASILVTGATGGLGRRVARSLAERGALLTLTARDAEALSGLGLGARRIALDLLEPASPGRAVAFARASYGRLDGVVSCAGAVAFGSLDETSPEVLRHLIELNLVVPLLLAREAIPVLEPGGFVANVSGQVAELPTAGLVAYSAAKAGVSAAYTALARELRRRGLVAIDLRPPHTETGLGSRPLAGTSPRLPEGLDPDAVAERIAAELAAEQRTLPAAAFA